MSHYSLVASGRADVQVNDMVLSRDDETGEPKHVLAVGQASEIPDDLLAGARALANRLGYQIIEVKPPDEEGTTQSEDLEANPQVGVDTVAAAPEVSDQQGESASAPQQGSDTVTAGDTTDYGSSATSDTTSATPPPSNV